MRSRQLHRPAPVAAPAQEGFTLIELSVTMGILGLFMLVLVELIFTSTELVAEGQAEQDLAARSLAATRPCEESLRAMIGPSQESRSAPSDARLLLQYMPSGEQGVTSAPEVQVLRATVQISRAEEQRLLRRTLLPVVQQVLGIAASEEELEKMLLTKMREMGGRGRAQMMLLPWPIPGTEGVYMSLRRGYFLAETALPFKAAEGASLMEVREIGGPRFPLKKVPAHTEVLAQDLLHCSFRMAHQFTQDWESSAMDSGPTTVWDSARVGWSLDQTEAARRFRFDKGPESARDSTDDVFPHFVEVTMVVGRSPQDRPEGMLAEPLAAGARRAILSRGETFPEEVRDNTIKIGSEWVRYSTRDGDELLGLRRGLRGTASQSHEAGTGVRVGRTVVLVIPVPHAKDDWNG